MVAPPSQGAAQATFEKLDGSAHELLVEIFRDGAVITKGSTTIGHGSVALFVNLTSGEVSAPVTSGDGAVTTTPLNQTATPATAVNSTATATPAANSTHRTTDNNRDHQCYDGENNCSGEHHHCSPLIFFPILFYGPPAGYQSGYFLASAGHYPLQYTLQTGTCAGDLPVSKFPVLFPADPEIFMISRPACIGFLNPGGSSSPVVLFLFRLRSFLSFILTVLPDPWYELRDDEMSWKRGVWFHTTGIVPSNRITNLGIRQGPVMRAPGISFARYRRPPVIPARPWQRSGLKEWSTQKTWRELIRSQVRQPASGDGTGGGQAPAATVTTDQRILKGTLNNPAAA